MTQNKYHQLYEQGMLPKGYYYIECFVDDFIKRIQEMQIVVEYYDGYVWHRFVCDESNTILGPVIPYNRLQEAIKKVESVKEWIDTHEGMEYSSGLFYALKLLKGEGNEIDRLCDSINHTRRIENE